MPVTVSQLQDEPSESPEEHWKTALELLLKAKAMQDVNKWRNTLIHPMNIVEEQAAIATIKKSDPTDFQEISASKLTLSNSFYNNALRQSQLSFIWALIWAGAGAIFIIVTVTLVILLRPTIANSVIIGLLGGTGGIGSETIAYATLQLYKHASDFILANSACEGLDWPEKQQMRSKIISKLFE